MRSSSGATGRAENRRFYVIDERDRMVNGKRVGRAPAGDRRLLGRGRAELRLDLPRRAGRRRRGAARGSGRSRSSSLGPRGQLVDGPWSEALSDFVGRPLRLVEAGDDRRSTGAREGAVSLISRASLGRLAQRGTAIGAVDVRRFRMLIEIDGVEAHAEDRWVGREVRVGAAQVEFDGHVGRCLITTRDPDTGVVDLPDARDAWQLSTRSRHHRTAAVRHLRRGARARNGPGRRRGDAGG